jgi:large subunit ribosomal protein L13
MLPKNKLGSQLYTKLKVYKGGDHPHQAQRPEPLTF